jgi:hypothetical protein
MVKTTIYESLLYTIIHPPVTSSLLGPNSPENLFLILPLHVTDHVSPFICALKTKALMGE